ncbi:MAG: hypothetical protein QW292_04630 [Candidatus Parvarchaeota archaeon]
MVTKKKPEWKEQNWSLGRSGELFCGTYFLSELSRKLRSINEQKEGGRYSYPTCMMSVLVTMHVYLLPYRELEVFVRMPDMQAISS